MPEFIALPLFRRIYPLVRKSEGSLAPSVRRRVVPVDPQAAYEFNRLFNASLPLQAKQSIENDLPYPKLDFLNHLCDWRGLVAHGTNRPDLEVLQPVRYNADSSEFGNRQQIFCSPDAIWAMWFAILDKTKYRTTRNGCVGVGSEARLEKYYHFELPHDLKGQFPFVAGTLYLARAEYFPSRLRIQALNISGGDFEDGAAPSRSRRWRRSTWSRRISRTWSRCSIASSRADSPGLSLV
ncbi:MAG: hypothetical protein FJZ96_01960 [Chloroflexi bacterium]|nr:hypothetical protein [Chloroflexota bacterium]